MISGDDLLSSICSGDLGLDPPEFFQQAGLLKGGEILIGRCSCGVVGCGDQRAGVEISSDQVIWHLVRDRRVIFDREQYETALAQGASATAWESVERTAERLVESLDFSARAERGYIFEWASARIKKGQITLSFTVEGRQATVDVGWDQQSPEDARVRVLAWIGADV
jgi:hypothetical protein